MPEPQKSRDPPDDKFELSREIAASLFRSYFFTPSYQEPFGTRKIPPLLRGTEHDQRSQCTLPSVEIIQSTETICCNKNLCAIHRDRLFPGTTTKTIHRSIDRFPSNVRSRASHGRESAATRAKCVALRWEIIRVGDFHARACAHVHQRKIHAVLVAGEL